MRSVAVCAAVLAVGSVIGCDREGDERRELAAVDEQSVPALHTDAPADSPLKQELDSREEPVILARDTAVGT
jgi:hypothetical protein